MSPQGHQRAPGPQRRGQVALSRRGQDWLLPWEVTLLPSPHVALAPSTVPGPCRALLSPGTHGGGVQPQEVQGEQLPRNPWSWDGGAVRHWREEGAVQAQGRAAPEASADRLPGQLLGGQTPPVDGQHPATSHHTHSKTLCCPGP